MTALAQPAPSEPIRPSWYDDLVARVAVSAQIVLAGAVEDLQVFQESPADRPATLTLGQSIGRGFDDAGYGLVLGWDLVNGVSALFDRERDNPHSPYTPNTTDGGPDPTCAARVLGDSWHGPSATLAQGVRDLPQILQRVVGSRDVRVGLVLMGASRFGRVPGAEPDVYRLHLIALDLVAKALSRAPLVAGGRRLFNPIVWVVDRESDLPHWLLTAPKVRVITVAQPVLADRATAARAIVPLVDGADRLMADPEAFSRAVDELAKESEGLTIHDMRAAAQLAKDRGIPASDVRQAVRFLRSGHRVSPWRTPSLRESIADAEGVLAGAVLGQDAAVAKASAILARSAMGLSGAHSSSHPSRPQGVMFLAGPTGVGKTELAKQIAALVFGRADAVVRFDMSEFAAEHTQARLLGSPPGYVGHEAGGELTNAVRDKPFSVLLFDEIEKAHERILDKFLQILEDGRLTDGAGSTVHFGETLIIFTSNEGTMVRSADGKRTPIPLDTEPADLEARIHEAIEKKFVRKLRRPELLNRIGPKNIVVFQYLTPPVARELADRDLDAVSHRVREVADLRVIVTDPARRLVHDAVTREEVLVHGGRGVGNEIEDVVVNPLSAWAIRNLDKHVVEIDAGPAQLVFRAPDGRR